MRISATQKDVLLVLYALEQKGRKSPVPAVDILTMLNKSKQTPLHGSNFRASCHKLTDHGLLRKARSQSLQLAFSLSDKGREAAAPIYAAIQGNAN